MLPHSVGAASARATVTPTAQSTTTAGLTRRRRCREPEGMVGSGSYGSAHAPSTVRLTTARATPAINRWGPNPSPPPAISEPITPPLSAPRLQVPCSRFMIERPSPMSSRTPSAFIATSWIPSASPPSACTAQNPTSVLGTPRSAIAAARRKPARSITFAGERPRNNGGATREPTTPPIAARAKTNPSRPVLVPSRSARRGVRTSQIDEARPLVQKAIAVRVNAGGGRRRPDTSGHPRTNPVASGQTRATSSTGDASPRRLRPDRNPPVRAQPAANRRAADR